MTRRIAHWLAAPVAAGLLAAAVTASPCAACSCAYTAGYDGHGAAAAVFRGTVLRVEPPRWWESVLWNLGVGHDPGAPWAVFRVEEVWKGPRQPEVLVANDGCGLRFAPGIAYVVYAYRREDGGLGSNGCRTTVGEDQPARFLGEQASLGPGTPVADISD